MEEYFAAKRALFEQAERAVVNVGDEWGARLAAELPGARTFTPDDELGDIDLKLRGALQPRERARRDLGGARARRRRGRDQRGIEALAGVPGRFESVDAGQPFAVIVDYAHTPDSLENVLRAARELGERRDRRLRRRRRPRPREAAADGSRSPPRSPTARSSRPTTRARRIPRRSPPRSPPGGSRSCSTGAPRSRRRSRTRGRATSS